MSGRYPDLNEPKKTDIGNFNVVQLNDTQDEKVECPKCWAIVRKSKAQKHATAQHPLPPKPSIDIPPVWV